MVKRPAFVLVLALASAACAGAQRDLQREFTPGVRDDARVHAFQAASFSHAFMQAHALEWDARLASVADDLPPLFEAAAQKGCTIDARIVAHEQVSDRQSATFYDVDLVVVAPGGKETFVLPGAQGTSPRAYVAALAPAAKRTEIGAEVLRRGHFALFKLATMSGSLSATDDAMRRHVFGLLALREKLRQKQPHADYLAPMRDEAESLKDVDLALRVMAEHFQETSRLRAEVVALLALARAYELPEARRALAEQVAESQAHARAWQASHPQPTADQFGVAAKDFKLPTPENMLAVLDKDGYVQAAVLVAKGAATGDAATTVEGLGKLAPKNSSLRVASEGTAAALRGDVGGAAHAALELASRQEDVAPVVARLRTVEKAASAAASLAKGAPRSSSELASRLEARAKDTARRAATDAAKGALERSGASPAVDAARKAASDVKRSADSTKAK